MAPLSDENLTIGFWGPTTSTLDWCEQNYEVNFYFAEFWNTLTNLSMIVPSIWGMYDVHKKGYEKRFSVLFGFLLLTGIGSWMFHMTLLYEMQLMDEIPMVWGSAYMVFCLYQVRVPKNEENIGVGIFMLSYSVLVTAVYVLNKNPIFHEVAYAILVFTMLGMDFQLNMKQKSKPGIKMFLFGLTMYLFGFFLWNLDNIFCGNLTSIRTNFLAPKLSFASPLTQLHGWWHLFAGYATYLHIISSIYHRQKFLKKESEFKLCWIGCTVGETSKDNGMKESFIKNGGHLKKH